MISEVGGGEGIGIFLGVMAGERAAAEEEVAVPIASARWRLSERGADIGEFRLVLTEYDWARV